MQPTAETGFEFISCGAAKALLEQVRLEHEDFNLFVEGELGAGRLARDWVIQWHANYTEFSQFYAAEHDIWPTCLDAVEVYNRAEVWQSRLKQWQA